MVSPVRRPTGKPTSLAVSSGSRSSMARAPFGNAKARCRGVELPGPRAHSSRAVVHAAAATWSKRTPPMRTAKAFYRLPTRVPEPFRRAGLLQGISASFITSWSACGVRRRRRRDAIESLARGVAAGHVLRRSIRQAMPTMAASRDGANDLGRRAPKAVRVKVKAMVTSSGVAPGVACGCRSTSAGISRVRTYGTSIPQGAVIPTYSARLANTALHVRIRFGHGRCKKPSVPCAGSNPHDDPAAAGRGESPAHSRCPIGESKWQE